MGRPNAAAETSSQNTCAESLGGGPNRQAGNLPIPTTPIFRLVRPRHPRSVSHHKSGHTARRPALLLNRPAVLPDLTFPTAGRPPPVHRAAS
jgi:hypothetical protein